MPVTDRRSGPPPGPQEVSRVTDWHTLESDELRRRLAVDPALGLSREEAARRRDQYGPNQLEERGLRGPGRILWHEHH